MEEKKFCLFGALLHSRLCCSSGWLVGGVGQSPTQPTHRQQQSQQLLHKCSACYRLLPLATACYLATLLLSHRLTTLLRLHRLLRLLPCYLAIGLLPCSASFFFLSNFFCILLLPCGHLF
jgi:hypothetical protein